LVGSVHVTQRKTLNLTHVLKVGSYQTEARRRNAIMIRLEEKARQSLMSVTVNESKPNALSQVAARTQPTTTTTAAVEPVKVTPPHCGRNSGVKAPAKFTSGAIAFMRTTKGEVWAYLVSVYFGRYYVSRNGRSFEAKADDLLTGFEPDFPDWSCINWGDIKPYGMSAEEEIEEDEASEAEAQRRESWESWEEEQYSDLLADYERREAAKPKAKPEDLLELPLFQLAS
jgi:hypothetical protein